MHKKSCKTLRQTYKDLKAKKALHQAKAIAVHNDATNEGRLF
jgi:ABC-type metal ion transport system substrate-binding protein